MILLPVKRLPDNPFVCSLYSFILMGYDMEGFFSKCRCYIESKELDLDVERRERAGGPKLRSLGEDHGGKRGLLPQLIRTLERNPTEDHTAQSPILPKASPGYRVPVYTSNEIRVV